MSDDLERAVMDLIAAGGSARQVIDLVMSRTAQPIPSAREIEDRMTRRATMDQAYHPSHCARRALGMILAMEKRRRDTSGYPRIEKKNAR